MESGRKRVWLFGGVPLAALATVATLLGLKWPYTRERIIPNLEQATQSRFVVQRFESTYFPPGCILEGVRAARSDAEATVQRIALRGSWLHLFTLQDKVAQIRISGAHITIDLKAPHPQDRQSKSSRVGDLIADGATVDFGSRTSGEAPLRFAVHQLRLAGLGSRNPIEFSILIDVPHPPGQVRASGSIGPLENNGIATPLNASFELTRGDLSRYENLAGIVEGKGKVHGAFNALSIEGSTKISGFEVDRNGHPTTLAAEYRARLNGANGDLTLESVEADLFHSHVSAAGTIAGKSHQHGKTASIDFASESSRIDDMLRLATRAARPALQGPLAFKAHAELPPGDDRFLRRIRLTGQFRIGNARWTRASTQSKVNEFSARGRGETDEANQQVLSDLSGKVVLQSGIARLTGFQFRVPGATASGGGTFNVITKYVNLAGAVRLEANMSEATSGFKSFLLKPLNFMFRKPSQGKRGATLRATLRGTYPDPRYNIGVTD